MRKLVVAARGALLLALAAPAFFGFVRLGSQSPTSSEQPRAQEPERFAPADSENAVIKEFCTGCHNDLLEWAGLTLEHFDVDKAPENAELAEKVIRKLRTGMMPPSTVKRPDEATIQNLAAALENRIDTAVGGNPNPGRRPFQRLNRAEYARAVRDLLDIEVDVEAFLPADTISRSFDNIADVQTFSATLMEGYLRAAGQTSRDALGDPDAAASEASYRVPRTASQVLHVEGAPIGTRGGISVIHNFPADGSYTFRMLLHGTPTGQLYGLTAEDEFLEVSIDGDGVATLEVDRWLDESDPNGMNIQTAPITVKAGQHRVSAAFLERFAGPVNDLVAHVHHTLADTQIGSAYGITTLPHLRSLSITGPFDVTGVSDTPSRRKVFKCRPTSAADEIPCARNIIRDLGTLAYRRSLDEHDMEGLLAFYRQGAAQGNFETGIRTALQAILASPHFVFRLEEAPAAVEPGTDYRISDLDLASRLSYFLWASAPDAELIELGQKEQLHREEVLQGQVWRMLDDPRSESLASRFAAQWLRLQDLDDIHPDALTYPRFDHTLAQSMRRETEFFFSNMIQEDRSVLDLLTAKYTFVNERLAEHYRLPNVGGNHFRRVSLEGTPRQGILGQGSILTLTSLPNRTSPVQRGKWVLEVLMGVSPPPPPPNVPDLEETKATEGARLLSVRERMEEHRKNPACTSCHRVIDPLGLALENFDPTGAWRIKDNGVPVDASGELYDGTPLEGPAGLGQALLKRKSVFLNTFTERLMTYALGRRIEYSDMPTIRRIVREATLNEHRLSSFLLGIVESRAFQMSRAEPGSETVTAAEQ